VYILNLLYIEDLGLLRVDTCSYYYLSYSLLYYSIVEVCTVAPSEIGDGREEARRDRDNALPDN